MRSAFERRQLRGVFERRWVRAAAGPALIVVAVLVVLNGFWWDPKLTNQQVDLLAFWLPRWCYLGDALAAGHVPTWLPHQFGGVPFASDPQSGWLYAPPMLLFSLMPCARALGLMVVLQPILAGLGFYGFLRKEGLERPAASVGGLTLSLAVAGSSVTLSLPFSGTLAWTSLLLFGAAGFLHAGTALTRLGWVAFSAFAWSQLAGAHLTHGLLMGTALVALYAAVRSVLLVRERARHRWAVALLAVGFLAALPVLSSAVLVPRLALLPRTSIGHGYQELGRLAGELSGTAEAPPFTDRGVGPWWGTSFARGPGGYVGPFAVALLPAAFASRRWRWPSAAFALPAFVGYLLNLDVIVRSDPLRRLAMATGLGELWLRSPFRFRYLLIPAFAAFAGYGLQAWLDRARGGSPTSELRRAAPWLGGVLVVFVALPLVAGARPAEYVPFAIGLAYGVPLLVATARGRRWAAAAIPALLALELTVVGLVAQAGPVPAVRQIRLEGMYGPGLGHSFSKFARPFIDPEEYLAPGAIGRRLIAHRDDHLRYLAFVPDIARSATRGFLGFQTPADWPAYENGRSILFGLEEVQGYSPVQVDRYWRLVRRVNPEPVFYNAASFQVLRRPVLDLFGVGWVIQRAGVAPPEDATPVARERRYVLYRLAAPTPRASVASGASVVPPGEALDAALSPSRLEPVIEGRRGSVSYRAPPGPVVYRERHPEDVRIDVPGGPGLLVVRNAFDRNWETTVDGRPARILRVDYVFQGVELPQGAREVRLRYRDDAIGRGLLASAVAWLVLGSAALGLLVRSRRPPAVTPPLPARPPPGDADGDHEEQRGQA